MRIETRLHPTPSQAAQYALRELGGPRPRSALLGLAGRVDAPVARLTNAPWVVDVAQIGADLKLSKVAIVNDYIPVAASLLQLLPEKQDELARIGPALPCARGTRLALGPGTGFGAAACVPIQNRYWLQATEAGHVDFGACTADELATWPLLEGRNGRISAETVLSGPGLVRLYHALAHRFEVAPNYRTPADVFAAAALGQDMAAREAVRLFVSLLGRYAGDLALLFNAGGGVFFGSGIAPRIIEILDRGPLRSAFERKPPFEAIMKMVPTFVITHPEPGMLGLAAIASNPSRFFFEAHGWSETA